MSRQAENAAETATLLDRSLSDDALRRHRCTIRGRDHETNQIWQAYQRVVTDGKKESMTTQSSSHRHHRQSEVILVSGPSGVGKSALANWLYTHQPHRDKASSTTDSTPETVESSGTKQTNYKDTYRRRPLFVNVQFDSLQHPDPYHDLSEALTEFVQLAIAEPQDIAHLREGWASLLSLDRNSECQTLMDTFPAFRAFLVDSNEQELLPTNETVRSKPGKDSEWKLISKSVKDTPSMYSETGARLLKNTLGLFVRAVACRRQRPLVFVFDDLHRANERSLDIVQALLEDKEICSAVFVATYEEKETYVNALSNPLRRFLDKLRIAKVRNTRLSLSSLGESDINSILVNDLHVEAGSSLSLSSLLMARTRGNCFGVWEYLRLMHKRKILFWDWSTDRCCFHMEEIRIQELDIDELIRTRINKLSEYNQNILKTAACLGRQIDPTILTCFTSGDDQSFQNFTARALMNDLICYDKDQNSWRFTHDLVQEIAYSLIPVNERPVFHYRIGRKLWRSFDLDMVDCYIFLIVEQLCHYVNQIEYKKERYAIAKLCLCAGVRAVRLSSFHSSMVFLEHGMSLLGTTSWDQEYTTCLDLHSAAAEVANSLGHFDQTKEIVGQILIHAKQFRDTFRGNAALVHSLSSDGKYSDAVKLAFNLLYQLGERFPAKTSRLSTALEFYTLKRRLSRKTNESILRLPLMTDENKLAAMQMLNLVFLSALLSNDKIIPILGFRMVRMSLDYGICAVSCIGFALFGGCLCS